MHNLHQGLDGCSSWLAESCCFLSISTTTRATPFVSDLPRHSLQPGSCKYILFCFDHSLWPSLNYTEKKTTMPSSIQILALLASCVAGASAASDTYDFGSTFYLGPPSSSTNYIASITYDLDDVPAVPSGYTEGSTSDPIFVSPWVGISSSISDDSTTLVQPLLNWSPDQTSQ